MDNNLILLTDSYKVSHANQYPPNTETIYSNFESRGGKFNTTVLYGLQYYLKKHLEGNVIDTGSINQAERTFNAHLGPNYFNRAGWEYIRDRHQGRLPVSIKAVPEGTVVPTKNVLMTIENTDPNCWWLTNYLETLLVQVWYPSTVATISREMKKLIATSLEQSAENLDGLPFKLHDFGARGVSSVESAAIGGSAHLVNFLGTDTVVALRLLWQYYNCPMAGFSIPASEHSTMTSWGKENELDAYRNMLEQFPDGLVAIVSDSWDIDNAARRLFGRELKDKILQRDGTVVIRPDSGDPTEVVPRILNILGQELGSVTNNKGYKMLPPQVRMIQGDGINIETLGGILNAVMKAGWSTDNLAFGSGGGLLQQCDRDTQNFAFKCSSATIDGKEQDVYKQPKTASWKASKKGRLKLVKDDIYGFRTSTSPTDKDELVEVFRDGQLLMDYTLDEIRERASM